MKQDDGLSAILHQLRLEKEPITAEALFAKLSLDSTERTMRRWLLHLVREGLIEKVGATRGAKYMIMQRTPSILQEREGCFREESLRVVEKTRAPLFKRMPVTYQDEWLFSYKENKTFYLPRSIREQLYSIGQRAFENDPAGTYAHQIFHRLLIDLSYNSSRLEGNTYSLLDTERLLLSGEGVEGKSDQETTMILNHKEAIRYLVDTVPSQPLNQKVIYTLHYLLAEGLVESIYAGKVRDHGVRIGGSTYIPMEGASRLEKQLEKIVEKAAKITDPFEQSFFLLVHISYLQAFTDVNKRTARLAANIPLVNHNLVPLSFKDVEVGDYMSAVIALYEWQDVRPLVDLYTYSYQRTCSAYDATVRSLGFDAVRVRYRQKRRELVREVIIKQVMPSVLDEYITSRASAIPEEERSDFIEDVLEDLQLIDESRLVGLGVTPDQMHAWLALSSS